VGAVSIKVHGFLLWRIFATWRHKKKGLANPTKGFLRIKKKLPYLEEKKVKSRQI
jgi:hypothetical protein